MEHVTRGRRGAASRSAQQRYGEQTWAMVERLVLLRTIDQLWVDHLTELDDFRRGVGLRGYGGTDPLVEFKREAFKLYEELRGFIRHQVATTIFRVNVQRRAAAPTSPRRCPCPPRSSWRCSARRGRAQRQARAATVAAPGGRRRRRRRAAPPAAQHGVGRHRPATCATSALVERARRDRGWSAGLARSGRSPDGMRLQTRRSDLSACGVGQDVQALAAAAAAGSSA